MIHHDTHTQTTETAVYHLIISGRLPTRWQDHFDGFHTHTYTANGREHTQLTGRVIDQANLHGLLAILRDLNLPLLAVFCDQFTYPFLQGDYS